LYIQILSYFVLYVCILYIFYDYINVSYIIAYVLCIFGIYIYIYCVCCMITSMLVIQLYMFYDYMNVSYINLLRWTRMRQKALDDTLTEVEAMMLNIMFIYILYIL